MKSKNIVLISLIIIVVTLFVLFYYPLSIGITIDSPSMEPTYSSNGFHIYDTSHEYSNLDKGDVIVFECDESSIYMHRIYTNTTDGFTTKGDNNEYSDQITGSCDMVTEDNYLGKVMIGY